MGVRVEAGLGCCNLLSAPVLVVLHLSLRSSLALQGEQDCIPCSRPAMGGCWEMAFQDRALSLFCFAGNCAEYVITFQEFSFYLPKYHLLPQVKWRLWRGESMDLFPWKSFTCWTEEGLSPTFIDCVPLEGRVILLLLSVFSRNEAVLKTQNNLFFSNLSGCPSLSSVFCYLQPPQPSCTGKYQRSESGETAPNLFRWFCSCQYFCFPWHMAIATKTQNSLFFEFIINSLKPIISWYSRY